MIVSSTSSNEHALPQKTPSYSLKVSSIASCFVSTIGGFIWGGPVGAVAGAVASIADEYLVHQNYTEKHLLTNSLFWYPVISPISSALSKAHPSFSYCLNGLSILLPLGISYFSEDMINLEDKIERSWDAFYTLNQLFDPENIFSFNELKQVYKITLVSPSSALSRLSHDVQKLYENSFLTSFMKLFLLTGSNVLAENLLVTALSSYSGSLFIHKLLDQGGLSAVKQSLSSSKSLLSQLGLIFKKLAPTLKEGSKIISIYILKSLYDFFSHAYESYVMVNQRKLIIQKGTDLLFDPKVAQKILCNSDDGSQLAQFLHRDLNSLCSSTRNLKKLFSNFTSTFFAMSNVMALGSPALLAPYCLFSIPYQQILKYLSNRTKNTLDHLHQVESKTFEYKSQMNTYMREIGLSHAESFSAHKLNELIEDQFTTREQLSIFSTLSKKTLEGFKALSYFSDMLSFIGLSLANPSLSLGLIPKLKGAIDQILSYHSSTLTDRITEIDTIPAKKRIERFLEIAQTPTIGKFSSLYSEDEPLGQITLLNYQLKLGDKTLVHIPYLEIESGKTYAITGKSGSGKTTVLCDLKLDEAIGAPLESSGLVSWGVSKAQQEPKLSFVPQDIYIPAETTLFESLCMNSDLHLLSEEEKSKLKENVIELMKELEVDEFVNTKDDPRGLISRLESLDYQLSGGQKSKTAIIRVLTAKGPKPDLLFLDETFTGLDPHSLELVQKALNKSLPQTTILSIDHHAKDNNLSGFYDKEICFSGQSATLQDLA